MSSILVTGGTVFVSRAVAEFFAGENEVFVLNRGSRPKPEGTVLIQADRHALGDKLRGRHFDAVIDVCAYDAQDVNDLLDALDGTPTCILISSSAVYPETAPQPMKEEGPTGPNCVWGAYGTNKLAAERALLSRRPDGYIPRPPYLYGPGQNLYREPFVFDCAIGNRPFFLPRDGSMPLQFFHVTDLCRMIEAVLRLRPRRHVFNVGNPVPVDTRTFVTLCYQAAGKTTVFREIWDGTDQRVYFCFHDYGYVLDVVAMGELLPRTVDLAEGLSMSLRWYQAHPEEVRKRDYLDYIDKHWRETPGTEIKQTSALPLSRR